jgi:hypothetical protein
MTIQDLVNGLFEGLGSLFISISILKLYRDKLVRGISYFYVAFFAVWGYWNIYYYPHLNQWFSFTGGLLVAIANTVYTIMLIYYTVKETSNDTRRT